MYNFETIGTRYTTGSKKWAEIHQYLPEEKGDIIPFSVADMELEIAPEIKEGMKKYIDRYVLGYANPTQEFRETVCDWMQKRHNWTIKPEWIVSTPGVINALYTSVQCFTNPGDGVMLLTPVYYPMYTAITSNKRTLVDCPLINNHGHYEINFADFEAKCKDPNTKMLIFCSPHNPSSRVWTKEELEKLAKICLDNDVLMVSDEIHFDLIMPGHTHTVLATLSEEVQQHSVICTAPSKSFNLAGMQTSNIIIANEDLRKKFMDNQLLLEMNPKCNILGYEANRLAYTYCADWLDQVVALIEKNRSMITEFLKLRHPEIAVTPMEGTYLLWMDFNKLGVPYKQLAEELRTKAKLFFDDGFIFGTQGEGFERWNLACPTRYAQEGLARLDAYLKEKEGRYFVLDR